MPQRRQTHPACQKRGLDRRSDPGSVRRVAVHADGSGANRDGPAVESGDRPVTNDADRLSRRPRRVGEQGVGEPARPQRPVGLVGTVCKRFPGHPRKVINGLWGLGLLMLAKAIVVFDDDVDVQNTGEAYWQMLGNVDWARDVVIQEGPTDALDHASYRFAYGGKIGIDATAKEPADGYTRGWPEPVAMVEGIREMVTRRWTEYGIS